ncbi:MAG: phosphoribosylanthranilate isomerase, partial [Acidimicrobiales bacterium]
RGGGPGGHTTGGTENRPAANCRSPSKANGSVAGVFVKICGTTSEEDALLAVAMGADGVGFIFAPSPRQVGVETVGDIVKRLPREIVTVGVFRDESPERVVEVCNGIGLRAAQLHGHETPRQARWVRERVPYVIQAFPAGDAAIATARDYGVDAIMIDAPRPGSGKVFDWSLADGAPDGMPLILAGGLTPENVGGAIDRVRPWGVDVVSGVESSPGHKDPRKLRAFVAAVRAAESSDAEGPVTGSAAAAGEPYDWGEDPAG